MSLSVLKLFGYYLIEKVYRGNDMSNIIEITDFNAPELDVYARLNENQLLNRANPAEGIFIAESPKVIERALDFGCEPLSLLLETRHVETQA